MEEQQDKGAEKERIRGEELREIQEKNTACMRIKETLSRWQYCHRERSCKLNYMLEEITYTTTFATLGARPNIKPKMSRLYRTKKTNLHVKENLFPLRYRSWKRERLTQFLVREINRPSDTWHEARRHIMDCTFGENHFVKRL